MHPVSRPSTLPPLTSNASAFNASLLLLPPPLLSLCLSLSLFGLVPPEEPYAAVFGDSSRQRNRLLDRSKEISAETTIHPLGRAWPRSTSRFIASLSLSISLTSVFNEPARASNYFIIECLFSERGARDSLTLSLCHASSRVASPYFLYLANFLVYFEVRAGTRLFLIIF